MEAQAKGPLHSLVEYELIEPGEKLQVFYKKRRVLSDEELASVTAAGQIIFRGSE